MGIDAKWRSSTTYLSLRCGAHNLLEKARNLDGDDLCRTSENNMKFIQCCEQIGSLIGLMMNTTG